MRLSRLSVSSAILVALLGLPAGASGADQSEPATMAFPTGAFVPDLRFADRFVEFDPDGTCRWLAMDSGWERPCTYTTEGDRFTELTSGWATGSQVPTTFEWSYDGELLRFEREDEELGYRDLDSYTRYPLRHIEDARMALVATRELAPGDMFVATRVLVPAGDVGADTLSDPADTRGRVAAVRVSRGQPITPDLLEPIE